MSRKKIDRLEERRAKNSFRMKKVESNKIEDINSLRDNQTKVKSQTNEKMDQKTFYEANQILLKECVKLGLLKKSPQLDKVNYEALVQDLKQIQYYMQIVITELGENLRAGSTYLEYICGLNKVCTAQDLQLFFMQLEC